MFLQINRPERMFGVAMEYKIKEKEILASSQSDLNAE